LFSIVIGFATLNMGMQLENGKQISSSLDAIYVSLMTLGFNDVGPKDAAGKFLVITEILNGILLFVGAFPFVLSRIASHDDAQERD
jgi:hypothetical protein